MCADSNIVYLVLLEKKVDLSSANIVQAGSTVSARKSSEPHGRILRFARKASAYFNTVQQESASHLDRLSPKTENYLQVFLKLDPSRSSKILVIKQTIPCSFQKKRDKDILQLLLGRSGERFLASSRYFVAITNEFSRFFIVIFFKTKR